MAFEAAMRIYELSKGFPAEERYSLTDQIRRSSRSVAANLAEAWRRRRYDGAFIQSLSHSEAEAAETQVWLEFAVKCGYLDREQARDLYATYDHILGKLVNMINHPNPGCSMETKSDDTLPPLLPRTPAPLQLRRNIP